MNQTQVNLLVTGATGFIGGRIVLKLLSETSHHLYCVIRQKANQDARTRLLAALGKTCRVQGLDSAIVRDNSFRLHAVEGDLTLPALGMTDDTVSTLEAASIRDVWHAAAALDFEDSAEEAVHTTNLVGTCDLLDLCARLSVGTFNHVSTAYVAGSSTGILREELSPNVANIEAFHNFYEQSKARAEHEVAARCEKNGIRYRIFRPSIVIGDSRTYRANSDAALYGLLRRLTVFKARTDDRMPGFFDSRALKVYGDGGVPLNLVPIDHVVDRMYAIAESEGTTNQIFHVVNPSPPTVGKVADVIATCLKVHAIDVTKDESEFGPIDNAFRKSYLTYKSYLSGERIFDTANVAKVLGPEAGSRGLIPDEDIGKYVLAYVEQRAAKEARLTTFNRSSRSVMTERQTKSSDGVGVTYFVSDDDAAKPTLLLINAFGMDVEFWGPTVNFFKDRFRIVTWNLRGLPDSAAFHNGAGDVSVKAHMADLEAVVAAEKIRDAVVLGWCSGARLALEFQRRRPDATRALVLVTGQYGTADNPDPEWTRYLQISAELGQRIQESPEVATLLVDSMFHANAAENAEKTAATNVLSFGMPKMEFAPFASAPFKTAENLVVYTRMLASLADHDVYGGLESIAVPTLIVVAEKDDVVHPSSAERLAKHIKNSEVHVLPEASHFCLVENAGTFVRAIARYFDKHALA